MSELPAGQWLTPLGLTMNGHPRIAGILWVFSSELSYPYTLFLILEPFEEMSNITHVSPPVKQFIETSYISGI